MKNARTKRLENFAVEYVRSNDLSRGYLHQMKSCANALTKALGRHANCRDLTVKNVNLVIDNHRVGKETRRNRRRMLLKMAREAMKAGHIRKFNFENVNKVKRELKLPKGYTIEQAKKLVTTVRNAPSEWLDGKFNKTGIVRRHWWFAYLMACWDTGHPQDLRSLTKNELDIESGQIFRLREKTGKVIDCRLSSVTLAAVMKIRLPTSKFVFPRWCNCMNRKCIAVEFNRIKEMAKLPGYIKWLRSGAGTAAEISHPGKGHLMLANSRHVFESNYLIRTELKHREIISPPPLIEN